MDWKRTIVSMAAVALSFSLLACGGAHVEEDTPSDSTPFGSNEKMDDKTNYSVCQNSAPLGITVYSSWRSDGRIGEDVAVKTVMTVENNALTVKRICQKDFDQITAQIRVNASVQDQYSGASILVLSNDVDSHENAKGLKCSLELKKETRINYKFKGPCLVIEMNGVTQTLIPAN